MSNSGETEEQQRQKAAAESLKRQIDDLKTGKPSPARPASLRDFVDRKMAEDKVKDEKSGE